MIENLLTSLISFILNILSTVISAILSIFGNIDIPALNTFASYLNSLWDLIFSVINYLRSALLLGSFEWSLIINILTIRILYKPSISLVKMFLGWFQKVKVT